LGWSIFDEWLFDGRERERGEDDDETRAELQ
jgi:hypothetical protein